MLHGTAMKKMSENVLLHSQYILIVRRIVTGTFTQCL